MTSHQPKPGGHPAGFGFGPLEQKLYQFLQAASWKKSAARKEKTRWEIVQHVWGPKADGRSRRRYFVRLRQLQRAVNRKLEAAGNPRRIFAPQDGYLTLAEPDESPPPPTDRSRPAAVAGGGGSRAAERCADYLRDCLASGIRRSKELEQLCCKQRWYSRRAYFQARFRLGLRAVRRRDGTGFSWELVRPQDEPPSDPPSQPETSDPLR
jgi:hypothetical protein